MSYKLGSLFDGSGGFPLSGTLCDIEPMWAAEVEPYPIAVTTSRFPNMKHLGDISKVNGAEIEPVDIITFGSPCQDLSVAGKRAGLKHEDNGDDETTRSGLFMEAVRIIKEMRKETNGEYPKFCCWENVPGAFSSNNGEDFRIVLQELIKIAEPNAVMPEVPKNGWAYADSYCGDGWSLAYRVFDAQHWGVPQRRRRIYLVTDFRGECAEKILFEREGLRGHFAESRTPGQAVTPDAERSLGADDREGEIPYTLKIRSGVSVDSYGKAAGKGALIQENKSATLGTTNDQYLFQPIGFDGYNAAETGDKSATLGVNCGMSSGRNGVITDTHILDDQGGSAINVRTDGKAPAIRAQMGGHPPVVMMPESQKAYGVTTKGNGDAFVSEERHTTLSVGGGQAGQGYPCVCYGVDAYNQVLTGDKAKTLNSAASDSDHVPCAVYSVENHPADSRVNLDESGKVQTLTSRMGTGGGNVPMVMEEVPKVINLNKDDVQSKTILDPKGIAPSLYAGECRGGGGECYVMEPFCKSRRAKSPDDATTWKHAEVANTLNTFDQGEARANEIIVMATQQGGAEIAHNLCPTITAAAGMSGNNQPVTVYALDQQGGKGGANYAENVMPTLCSDSHGTPHGVAYADCLSFNWQAAPGAGLCVEDDIVNPLACTRTPAIAYGFDPGASRDVGTLFIEECGKTLTNGTCPGHHDGVVIATNSTEQILRAIREVYKYNGVGSGLHIVIDDENIEDEAIVWCLENSIPEIENEAERTACEVCAKLLLGVTYDERSRIMDRYWRNPRPIHSLTTGDYMQVNEEKTATLLARDYKDPTCVEFYDEKTRNYIVRRLTPTECARLQGFPDKWGHLEPKDELTDEEYRFWLNVRKTHDAINGRAVKDYNEKQMLTYYNKLWTDSAEYKMWGNGIALPCALYVMQGIKDALVAERTARSKWLDELLGGL